MYPVPTKAETQGRTDKYIGEGGVVVCRVVVVLQGVVQNAGCRV
jgi:hypothetical protein